MKRLLKYLFVLFMSVGVFFLTTDIDSFIFKMDNQTISQIVDNQEPENSDKSDSIHHGVEDLFHLSSCPSYSSGIVFIGKIGFIAQRIEYKFPTQIWQPPKLS